MSVGFPIGKSDIDQKAATLAFNLRTALQACSDFCDLLNDTSVFPADNSTLTALGYTPSECTLLRAAFTDAKALWQVSHGQRTQPGANDFFFNLKHLTGVV